MIVHKGAWAEVLVGDCIASMATLPAQFFQTCITSPPYWGLRDYGHAGQIGLESTPDEYVGKMVDVFRAVRRVLRDDGTLWLNLGDSYTGSAQSGGPSSAKLSGPQNAVQGVRMVKGGNGLKPKDLVGIPWRVAFALQADGWYLRQDIIWHKPNPMPESVTDRCTKAHEYLFLLAKSEKYYFNSDAIKEPFADERKGASNAKSLPYSVGSGRKDTLSDGVKAGLGAAPRHDGRNKRDVWTIAPKPFKGAHFAVFPPALIEPCVLAGSREGDLVLDPFGGSGTTAQVALQHKRNAIICELNPEYAALLPSRIATL